MAPKTFNILLKARRAAEELAEPLSVEKARGIDGKGGENERVDSNWAHRWSFGVSCCRSTLHRLSLHTMHLG